MPKSSPEPKWLRDLRERKEPLSLAIDESGYIEAWRYAFEGPHDYKLMIWHPEGDLDFGFDAPTRRERYELDTPTLRGLSFETQKATLIDAIYDLGDDHLLADGMPWLDTEVGMSAWLDEQADSDDEPLISEWDNQHRFGHPIYDVLMPKERAQYGVRQGDAGGPGSGGCMVTSVQCSMAKLNELIHRKNLPFVVVEDRR